MKHCKNCKNHTIKNSKDFCSLKSFYVSYNANWCDDFKTSLLTRIKNIFR